MNRYMRIEDIVLEEPTAYSVNITKSLGTDGQTLSLARMGKNVLSLTYRLDDEHKVEQLKDLARGFELVEIIGIPGHTGLYHPYEPIETKIPGQNTFTDITLQLEYVGRRHLDKLTEREYLTYFDTLMSENFEDDDGGADWGAVPANVSRGYHTGRAIPERNNAYTDCFIETYANSATATLDDAKIIADPHSVFTNALTGQGNNTWAIGFGEPWFSDYIFTGYFSWDAAVSDYILLRSDPYRTDTFPDGYVLKLDEANQAAVLYSDYTTKQLIGRYQTTDITWDYTADKYHFFKCICIGDQIWIWLDTGNDLTFIGKAINSKHLAGRPGVGGGANNSLELYSDLMLKVGKPRLLGHSIGFNRGNYHPNQTQVATANGFQYRSSSPQISIDYETKNKHTTIRRGLIGEYLFDEGKGTKLYDHSGRENHGTISGAIWVWDLERHEWCLEFDGTNDEITITPDSNIPYIDGLSVETVVYQLKESGSTNRYHWSFGDESAANYLGLTSALGDERVVPVKVTTSADLITHYTTEANKWKHIVFRTDIHGNTVFVDGIRGTIFQAPTNGGEGLIILPESTLDTQRIGSVRQNAATSGYFLGKINRCRIWDRALTDTEIELLYTEEFGNE